MKKPGFWRLLGACLIDWTILVCFDAMWLFGIFVLLPILHTALSSAAYNTVVTGLTYLNWLLIVINIGYFAFLEKGGKGSLGKRVVNLKIQPASSFWKVFAAYGIDFGLFVLIGVLMYFYMKYNLINHLSAADLAYGKIGMEVSLKLMALMSWISNGLVVGTLFYFSVLESCFGKTLGKKLMGLQVVQEVPQKQQETK